MYPIASKQNPIVISDNSRIDVSNLLCSEIDLTNTKTLN